MNQVRDDDSTGQELFIEELGQVLGGQADPEVMPSVGRTDIEVGVRPPVRPWKPSPVTQALHETGPTPPVPKDPIYSTMAVGEEGVTPPHSDV